MGENAMKFQIQVSQKETENSQQIEEDDLKSKQPYIGLYSECEEYMRDNKYILGGYRINFSSFRLTMRSLFMLHNQTLNIWTHLLGSILTLLVILYLAFFIKDLNGVEQQLSKQFNDYFRFITGDLNLPDYRLENTTLKNEQYVKLIEEINTLDNVMMNGFSRENLTVLEKVGQKAQEILNPNRVIAPNEIQQRQEFFFQFRDSFLKIRDELLNEVGKQNCQFFGALLISSNQINEYNFDWVEFSSFFQEKSELKRSPAHIPRWPIFFMLVSGIACMMCSTIYHSFCNYSQVMHQRLLRVDYAGICFLMLGGTYPAYFYGFYCQQGVRNFYLLITGIGCLTVFIVSLFDFVHTEQYRKAQGMMYGGLGIFVGLPLFHLLYQAFLHGPDNDYLPFITSIPFYFFVGLSFLGGLCIYIARCPERWRPGKFDTFGHSHMLWHICVFIGVLFVYGGSISNLYQRKRTYCFLD